MLLRFVAEIEIKKDESRARTVEKEILFAIFGGFWRFSFRWKKIWVIVQLKKEKFLENNLKRQKLAQILCVFECCLNGEKAALQKKSCKTCYFLLKRVQKS